MFALSEAVQLALIGLASAGLTASITTAGLVLISRQSAARHNEIMPVIQDAQAKITEVDNAVNGKDPDDKTLAKNVQDIVERQAADDAQAGDEPPPRPPSE